MLLLIGWRVNKKTIFKGINMTIQILPQIIALVLAHLKPRKASLIIQKLPLEILGDVAGCIVSMNHANPEIILEIERVLEEKMLSGDDNEDYIAVDDFENINDEKKPSEKF